MVCIWKFRIIVLVSNRIEYWSNYSIWFKISNIRTALRPGSRLGADSEAQVCRYITSKSGDMTKETQSSFTDDVWDVKQAGTVQNFIWVQ